MPSFDDNSDILGGQLRIQPVWFTFSFWVKTAFVSVLGIVSCTVFLYTRTWYLNWKEERHRLSLRRKYGIPDNDHRPFNVAWAAVQRAQRDKKIAIQVEKRLQPAPSNAEQQLRHRLPVSANQDNQRPASIPTWAPGVLNSQPFPQDSVPSTQPHLYASSSRASSHRPSSIGPSYYPISTSNNTYDSSTLDDISATSRRGSPLRSKRGAKRLHHDEEEEETLIRQKSREKRARNISLESVHPIEVDEESQDEDMESSEDEVDELPMVGRGKKRDRAEAGSTFGGDSSSGEEETKVTSDLGRKRRTINGRRKSEVHPRGTKRDRDSEAESQSEGEEKQAKNIRKKRGKPSDAMEVGDLSDVSMEDTEYSTDVMCAGRRIGEKWESNGIHFKVGPNGDRLRQALVKKARSRYSMPKDSLHPDSQANVEVFVEVWMTEDEYQDAKARQALAWQDSVSPSPIAEDPINAQSSAPAPKGGKALIWSAKTPSSRSNSAISRVPSSDLALTTTRRAFRPSLTGNFGPQSRGNPFHLAPETPSRRISAVGLADSTNNTPESKSSPVRIGGGRVYSKWEKQELEAATMKRIRSKLEEAKKKNGDVTAPAVTVASPAPTSTISFPKPADKPIEKVQPNPMPTTVVPELASAAKQASFSPFAVPSAPATNSTPTPPVVSSVPGPIIKPAVSSVPPTEKSKPSFGLGAPPSKPTVPAAQPSAGAFSFTKPNEPAPAPVEAPFTARQTPTPAPSFSFQPQAVKKPESTTPATSSLLSRINPQPPAPVVPSAPTRPTSAFSFTKPTDPAPATTTTLTPPSNTAGSETATAAPKFNFGFGNAPTKESTPAQPAQFQSSLNGALDSSANKPVESTSNVAPPTGGSSIKFNFGAPVKPTTSAPTVSNSTSSATPTLGNTIPSTSSAPSFSFGNAPKPAEANSTTTKSPFSFSSVPVSTPSSETPQPSSSFSSAASTAQPNSATVVPKTSFSFGTPASSVAPSAGTTKPTFSFGGTTPAAGASSTPSSAFGSSSFGVPPSSAPSPFGATNTTQSAFGNTAGGPTAFGFAKPTSSPFSFGVSGQQKQESK